MVATLGDSRKIVYVKNTCYVCNENYQAPGTLLNHMATKHARYILSRKAGENRAKSQEYIYVNNSKSNWDEQRYGCPGCWFYCENLEELEAHVDDEHPNPTMKVANIKSSSNKKSVHFEEEQSSLQNDEKEIDNKESDGDMIQQIIDIANRLKNRIKL